MMGAEGEGLRMNLQTKASHNVMIAGQHRDASKDMGVDSLNVGAATAVLIEAFMRPPVETRVSRIEREESAIKGRDEGSSEDGADEHDNTATMENTETFENVKVDEKLF